MRVVKAVAAVALVLGGLVLLGGVLTGGDARGATTKTVRITDFSFRPGVVRIDRGDTVVWRWRDAPAQHDVTSRGTKRFRSSRTMARGSHRVRFTRAGTYRYVCTVHPGMAGRVVVR